jgi:undecaprenyl-diphosphatase
MLNYLQILLLAVIQGAAELLPVSSTAHVILATRLMGEDPSKPKFVFLLVMLHTGTMFAVLLFFWQRWRALLQPTVGEARTGSRWNWHFLKMVVIATVATGVLGFGLQFLIEKVIMEKMLHYEKGQVEELFKELPLIASGLFAVGLIILAADFMENAGTPRPLTTMNSIWIGLMQGLCLPFRGFSRSGATISTGLFCGVSRRLSEEFSFALAVVLTPPLILRQFWKMYADRATQGDLDIVAMLLPGMFGMVCSFLAGLLALRLLSAVLESGRWRYFGVYCLVFAGVVFTAGYLLPPLPPTGGK